MRVITKDQLAEILNKHKKWIMSEDGGERANLSNADLRNADLSNANLWGANLSNADLWNANLWGANLSNADLRNANLSNADLRNADLSNADLWSADLRNVKSNEGTGFLALSCPEEGSFIGWKTANGFIVKLRITEDAKRSSATTRKCRCSKAEVLSIQNVDGTDAGIAEVRSDREADFRYRVGETVEVLDFDENRWNECSTGIHFFITRAEAVSYGK